CAAAVPERAGDNPTAAYLMPLVALLATSLLTGAASRGGFDLLYGVRVAVAWSVLWHFRGRLATAGWRPSWVGAGVGVAAFALWVLLAGAGEPGGAIADGLSRLDPATRGVWLLLRLAGSIAVVPLVEELAFRGYVARRLTSPDFEAVAPRGLRLPAVVSPSPLFGLVHRPVVAGPAGAALLRPRPPAPARRAAGGGGATPSGPTGSPTCCWRSWSLPPGAGRSGSDAHAGGAALRSSRPATPSHERSTRSSSASSG